MGLRSWTDKLWHMVQPEDINNQIANLPVHSAAASCYERSRTAGQLEIKLEPGTCNINQYRLLARYEAQERRAKVA